MPQTAALITALILERPLCFTCIAEKADTSETAVEAALAIIAPAVQVHREHHGRCRACGQTAVVVSVLGLDDRLTVSERGAPKPTKLIDLIRQKVDARELPKEKPDKVWSAHGTLVPCDACGARILPAQVEHSFTIGEQFFRFHVSCYGLWEAERRRRGGAR